MLILYHPQRLIEMITMKYYLYPGINQFTPGSKKILYPGVNKKWLN